LDKDEFIRGLSRALGRERAGVPPGRPSFRDKPEGMAERAADIGTRLADQTSELTHRLSEVADARGWRVRRVEGSEGALDCIRELASGVSHVVRSDQDVFSTVPVDGVLKGLGIGVTVMTRGSGVSAEEQRAIAAEAGMGITGADYAVAETGSVVLLARPETSRLVSLVPPIHLAIVFPEQIIETLDDLFVLRRAAYYEGGMDMGSYLNLITGPSRTADIEQKLVVGVHGPKEAHLVLVE
jgi:L-lactate utilization protein LutC